MGSFRAFWVSDPTLANFAEVGNFSGELAFGRYLLNSLIILALTVGSGLIVNSMAGFVLAWGSVRGRALILRSEEHTSELQSLMRISYAVFCLKKKNNNN